MTDETAKTEEVAPKKTTTRKQSTQKKTTKPAEPKVSPEQKTDEQINAELDALYEKYGQFYPARRK